MPVGEKLDRECLRHFDRLKAARGSCRVKKPGYFTRK